MNNRNSLNFAHRWNSLLCPPIGLFFNFLLIFLVQMQTPKEMHMQSQILLQTAILDIFILILTLFGQPLLSLQHGTLLLYFEGIFIQYFESDSMTLLIFVTIFYIFSMLDIYGLAVQFLYRYLLFNRDTKLSLKQYLCLLFSIFIALCIFYIYRALNIFFSVKLNENDAKLLMDGNEPTKFYIALIERNFLGILFDLIFALLSMACYGIIGFCGLKVAKFVNSNLTGRKMELSKQMNRTLALMAILPMMFTTISMLSIGIDILATNGVSQQQQAWISTMEMSLFMLNHYIPILNPLVSIFTNAPYRKAISMMMNKIMPTNSNQT